MAEFCNRHAWPKSEEHLDTFGGGIRRPMGVFGGHTRGYAPTADVFFFALRPFLRPFLLGRLLGAKGSKSRVLF